MKKITKCLFVLLAIVLLVQVIPAMADGPDHRPDAWEQTATAEAGGGKTREPERTPRPTATATVEPYPIETPDPYPMPEATPGFFEWLRSLLWTME